MARILIVGIGNVLLRDEGLGVHVARALLADPGALPPGVEVLDAGTSLFDTMAQWGRCEHLILVDAVRAGGTPGTIYRASLDGLIDASPPGPTLLSLHDWSATDTLRVARTLGLLPARASLVGAEPGVMSPGTDLSGPLARARDRIVAILLADPGGVDTETVPPHRMAAARRPAVAGATARPPHDAST